MCFRTDKRWFLGLVIALAVVAAACDLPLLGSDEPDGFEIISLLHGVPDQEVGIVYELRAQQTDEVLTTFRLDNRPPRFSLAQAESHFIATDDAVLSCMDVGEEEWICLEAGEEARQQISMAAWLETMVNLAVDPGGDHAWIFSHHDTILGREAACGEGVVVQADMSSICVDLETGLLLRVDESPDTFYIEAVSLEEPDETAFEPPAEPQDPQDWADTADPDNMT